MSFNLEIVIILYLGLVSLILLAYFYLPKEKYQFLMAVPKYKKHEKWVAENYTFYGAISASASVFGITVFYILMLLPGYNPLVIAAVIAPVFGVAMVAAKILAAVVEKKKNIISVGAALFAAFLFTPVAVYFCNLAVSPAFGIHVDYVYFLTAASVSFLFGEGMGRIACISFGCCYGKPVCELSSIFRSLFSSFNTRFFGTTKKISYASGLEGKKVVPIQTITSMVYVTSGCVSLWVLLSGKTVMAFLAASVTIFVWRFLSEFFRADYRGGRKISIYQVFSIVSMALVIVIAVQYRIFTMPDSEQYSLVSVLGKLWDPAYIVSIQILWWVCFIYMGKSTVSGSKIKFFIKSEEI